MSLRRIATTVAVTTTAVVSAAAPSHATDTRIEFDPSTHPPVVWTCDDGTVLVGGVTEGYIIATTRTTPDGTELMTMNMNYRMETVDTSDGTVLESRGTMRLVFDFTHGTVTETGNSRNLTVPGVGSVVLQAGRHISGAGVVDPIWSAGPYATEAEDGVALCTLLGHDG